MTQNTRAGFLAVNHFAPLVQAAARLGGVIARLGPARNAAMPFKASSISFNYRGMTRSPSTLQGSRREDITNGNS